MRAAGVLLLRYQRGCGAEPTVDPESRAEPQRGGRSLAALTGDDAATRAMGQPDCDDGVVPSALETERVRRVLDDLRVVGEEQDGEDSSRVGAREAELGERLDGVKRAEIGAKAPQAVAPEVARILYALTIATRPGLVVEFGASFGNSTIHLAAALNDLGSGRLVTTELVESKARAATENLEAAGLASQVEVRHGDARSTLGETDGPIDMLFLDGSNDLYVEVLKMLEPRLSSHALVAADLSHGDPHHLRYREYVSAPWNGYLSVEIPVDAGLVISARQ